MGQYHSLFEALGVTVNSTFRGTQGFTHPIPEEQQKLQREFFGTMQIVKSTLMQFKKLTLINSRTQNSTVTFVFECNE